MRLISAGIDTVTISSNLSLLRFQEGFATYSTVIRRGAGHVLDASKWVTAGGGRRWWWWWCCLKMFGRFSQGSRPPDNESLPVPSRNQPPSYYKVSLLCRTVGCCRGPDSWTSIFSFEYLIPSRRSGPAPSPPASTLSRGRIE